MKNTNSKLILLGTAALVFAVFSAQGRLSLPGENEGKEVLPPNQVLPVGEKLATVDDILPKKDVKVEQEIKFEEAQPAKEEPAKTTCEKPCKVCVLDFTTVDTTGQERFLSEESKPIEIPEQNTLNEVDHKKINSTMQGYVRIVDAIDTLLTHSANRKTQVADNALTHIKAKEIFNTVVHGPTRTMVIGADYLEAYLNKHSDAFVCMSRSQVYTKIKMLQDEPDFPDDFFKKIAKETGATHLIYGQVSDVSSKEVGFEGYGVSTKKTQLSLDVIIKVVDLNEQANAHVGLYTGEYSIQSVDYKNEVTTGIFQLLMKDALAKAAEDLYKYALPGGQNKIHPPTEESKTE